MYLRIGTPFVGVGGFFLDLVSDRYQTDFTHASHDRNEYAADLFANTDSSSSSSSSIEGPRDDHRCQASKNRS
jgi:hypothetical protein